MQTSLCQSFGRAKKGRVSMRPFKRGRSSKIMANVAFIGLGVMGDPMAGHLAKRGNHTLTVFNRTAAKAEKWVSEHGGKAAPTPRAAAEGADFVFTCVGNDEDLRSVTTGTDGAF